MLIDSHCHLDYDYGGKTSDDLVREGLAAGIDAFVTIGTDLTHIDAIEAISSKHPQVFHTVGVHPHEGSTLTREGVEELRRRAKHPRCRAIGEIGLDYYYKNSEPAAQKQALFWQLELALELGQPIVVHSRDAEADLLPELQAYARKVPQGRPVGAIHCFTGTRAFGEACLAEGFLVSFSGILTFKNATDLQECARAFPLEKLMVETDSPFLAPVPYRGKKCEPAMVKMTAMKLAELKGVTLDEVARKTSENARRLFRIA